MRLKKNPCVKIRKRKIIIFHNNFKTLFLKDDSFILINSKSKILKGKNFRVIIADFADKKLNSVQT